MVSEASRSMTVCVAEMDRVGVEQRHLSYAELNTQEDNQVRKEIRDSLLTQQDRRRAAELDFLVEVELKRRRSEGGNNAASST